MEGLIIRPYERSMLTTFEKRNVEKIYSLTSFKSPGIVIIYNHFTYPNASKKLSDRVGTDKDVNKLRTLFKNLKFDVNVYDDLTSDEIKVKLMHHISTVDWENSGSIVLIVMTHGEENGMLWASDQMYHCSQLWDPILQCDKLKDTFKFIILQACRGSKREKKFNLMKLLASKPAEVEEDEAQPRDQAPTQICLDLDDLITYKHLPNSATNFLISHSTVEGCDSVRNTEKGTWYFDRFCHIIGTQWGPYGKDLLEALTFINNELVMLRGKENSFIKGQTTSFTSYLHQNIIYGSEFSPLLGNIRLPMKTYKGRVYIYYDKNHINEAKEFSETWEKLLFLSILFEIDHGETALKHMSDIAHRNDFHHEDYIVIAVFTKCETIINNNVPLKQIYNNFSAEKCPSLAGQMKLFFFFDMKYEEELDIHMDNWNNSKNIYITNHADFLIVRGHSKEFLNSLNNELLTKTWKDPFYHMVLIITTAMASKKKIQKYSTNIESTLTSLYALAPFAGAQLPRSLLEENKIVRPVHQIGLKEPYTKFTGREEELQKLITETSNKNAGRKIIKVSGMSGVGKTQLVSMFTRYYAWMFNNILWINSETEISLLESFQVIALKIELYEEDKIPSELSTKNLVAQIYEFFKKSELKTLFVFDNYVEDAAKYFPEHVETCEMYHIITTNVHSQSNGEQEVDIPIQCLNKDISMKMLRKFLCEEYNSEDDLEILAEKLGNLPLLLQLSATYIHESQEKDSDYSINKFLQEFEEDSQKVTNKEVELQFNQANYHYTFYRVCQLKVNKIESKRIPFALPILFLLAFCEPDDIPLSVFLCLYKLKSKPNTQQNTKLYEDKVNLAIRILRNESLISNNKQKGYGNIHRLLQECLRHIVREKDREISILETALDLIQFLLQQDSKKMNGFEAHAVKLFENAFKHDFKDIHIETVVQFSKYLKLNHKFGLAFNFLEMCTGVFEKKFGVNSNAVRLVKDEMVDMLHERVAEMNI